MRLVLTAAAVTLLAELRERRHRAVQAVLDRMPPRAQHELLLALLAFGQAAGTSPPAPQADTTIRTA